MEQSRNHKKCSSARFVGKGAFLLLLCPGSTRQGQGQGVNFFVGSKNGPWQHWVHNSASGSDSDFSVGPRFFCWWGGVIFLISCQNLHQTPFYFPFITAPPNATTFPSHRITKMPNTGHPPKRRAKPTEGSPNTRHEQKAEKLAEKRQGGVAPLFGPPPNRQCRQSIHG